MCYDLTLFLPREDGLYERDEEIHYQKAYDPEKVRELLEKQPDPVGGL